MKHNRKLSSEDREEGTQVEDMWAEVQAVRHPEAPARVGEE